MATADISDLWWKHAVIYCVDIETFIDSDHDGVGDIAGLTSQLDYLAGLGITCLWLMPFYPTPDNDDGYDIVDFYGVDPRLGSLGDLVSLVRSAHDRGIRVIADLVVNHTSDQHPWFKESRSSTDNIFRDYYVWRSTQPPDTSDMVVFHDEEDSIWAQDEATGHWYLHRFYSHQPDLNLANPAVRDEIAKIMGFWLELGLDGFRMDAVPQLLTVGLHDLIENRRGFHDPHEFLRTLSRFTRRRNGRAVLLGEVNLPYDEQLALFGDEGDEELTMVFDFVDMQHLHLSMARQDATALADSLRARPDIPHDGQWVTFVRNHDELALDQLTESQRQEVFAAFGPEERMQLYGRGLRRRLPTMLDGDLRRLRMVYSLLFSLPGSPALYYGEEIGMGENLDLDQRMAVRTPMQWSSGRNGGFSGADPQDLARPMVAGRFGPEHVNVAEQQQDPDSLLSFITVLTHRYRECVELSWGDLEVLEHPVREVLAHRCSWQDSQLIALHNFSPDPTTVPLRLPDLAAGTELADLLRPGRCALSEDATVELDLQGYGYRWLRVHPREGGPSPTRSTLTTQEETS